MGVADQFVWPLERGQNPSRPLARVMALLFAVLGSLCPTYAQEPAADWQAGVSAGDARAPDPPKAANSTTVPRTKPENDTGAATASAKIKLVALLTDNGQRIDKGLIWRVFQSKAGAEGKTKLLSTLREASPTLKLEPGDYVVNAAFGRAHLTRKISLKNSATDPVIEQFVLNAGGLRVSATVNGTEAAPGALTYDIMSDRDQTDRRKAIMTSAKPGLIIRLNAGIYHIVSTYGDANAAVDCDVTVEAGKLTEATLTHSAAKVTLKLVLREGGEAQSDTQWRIETLEGLAVKETVGALPTHFLAPGKYRAKAISQGKTFAAEFEAAQNQPTVVEVLMQ